MDEVIRIIRLVHQFLQPGFEEAHQVGGFGLVLPIVIHGNHLVVRLIDEFLRSIPVRLTVQRGTLMQGTYQQVFSIFPDIAVLPVVLLCIAETEFEILFDSFEGRVTAMIKLFLDIIKRNRPLDEFIIIGILSF